MTIHHSTITHARSYWWACSCGDEGGPHDSFNQAHDAVVRHERRERKEKDS